MKHLNQKGFTLVEIIGAITILTIMTVLTITAFVKYLDWSRKKSFDTMAKSASTAAEQYIMDYPHASVPEKEATDPENYKKGISFQTLADEGYLNGIQDPADPAHNCSGKVIVGFIEADEDNSRALDQYMFVVHECCSNFKARYIYTVKTYETEDRYHNIKVVRKPVEEISLKEVICE